MSKKFKLLFISLLCIILCASVLTSCDFEEDVPQDTQDEKVELSFNQVYAYAQEAGYTGTLEELIELHWYKFLDQKNQIIVTNLFCFCLL